LSTRGFSINISERLTPNQAHFFAQWIGAANVMRNQKISEFKGQIAANDGDEFPTFSQGYAPIKGKEELFFLREVPVQILRNAATEAYQDTNKAKNQLVKFPRVKNKFKKRSVVITKELFQVEPFGDGSMLTIMAHAKKKPRKVFSIRLPHKPEQLSNQFRISRQGRKFSLSGSYNNGLADRKVEQVLADYAHLPEDELLGLVTGVDRGIALHLCSSDGYAVKYSPEEVERKKERARRKAHYQRILARKKRLNGNKSKSCESSRQEKLRRKIARIDTKNSDCRTNHNHHISKELVAHSREIIGLEKLNLKGMTRKAKPKRDASGRKFMKNHARAKSGLNRSLLDVSLGQLATFIEYKALDAGKVAINDINPVNSSRECSCCGSLNTDRPTQAEFICLDCGNKQNADENASFVLRKRTVIYIKEEMFADKAKTRKKVVHRRKKLAA
jgi:transposase